jgi:hypothetical protein
MEQTQRLLTRLDEIGRSLENGGLALALIGLGSVGLELARLDEYSDLDFFVIAGQGNKQAFIDDLGWLGRVCPVAYAFRNTADGYKLLFEDGIFCEFAVFEPAELETAAFAPGRVVWKQPGVADTIAIPAKTAASPAPRSIEWLVGEALTNLYVGLGRERRGERLSAMRFIQGYAVDRVVELAAYVEQAASLPADPYAPERRFEGRFPGLAASLPQFAQGYLRNRQSALAILAFLERRFSVSPAMAALVRALAEAED